MQISSLYNAVDGAPQSINGEAEGRMKRVPLGQLNDSSQRFDACQTETTTVVAALRNNSGQCLGITA